MLIAKQRLIHGATNIIIALQAFQKRRRAYIILKVITRRVITFAIINTKNPHPNPSPASGRGESKLNFQQTLTLATRFTPGEGN